MKNVLNDKENKTLGQWKIDPDTIDQLKYAYAYLTNSNKMIVKKYEIDHFEFENAEKGYDHKDKYCLVFDKSEDVFFEYTYSPVRLELSKTSNVINNIKKIKPSSIDDARARLNKIWKEEFPDRKYPPHVDDAKKIIAKAEEDLEQDLSALLTEYNDKLDKNKDYLYEQIIEC